MIVLRSDLKNRGEIEASVILVTDDQNISPKNGTVQFLHDLNTMERINNCGDSMTGFPALVAYGTNFENGVERFCVSYSENEPKSSLLWDFAGVEIPEEVIEAIGLITLVTEDNERIFIGTWQEFVDWASPDQIVKVAISMSEHNPLQ